MKKNSNAAETLVIILSVIALFGFSWLVTCGIVKLITMCFGLTFSWSIGTGIWFIFILINLLWPKNKE